MCKLGDLDMDFLMRKKKNTKILDFLGNKVSYYGNSNDILYQYSYSNKSKIYHYASSLGNI